MAHWYVAHTDELLLDLDEYARPSKRGGAWGEIFFRRRLRDAMLSHKLDVEQVWLTRSTTAGRFHAYVKLADSMPHMKRLVWQLHLGSDLYRGRADLMRLVTGDVFAPSLLIESGDLREREHGFYRAADAVCGCEVKHSTDEQAVLRAAGGGCPVFALYRGRSPWELFGKPAAGGRPEYGTPLPEGRVRLELILRAKEPTLLGEKQHEPGKRPADFQPSKAKTNRVADQVGRTESEPPTDHGGAAPGAAANES